MSKEERLQLLKYLHQLREKNRSEAEEMLEPVLMELSEDTIAGSVED